MRIDCRWAAFNNLLFLNISARTANHPFLMTQFLHPTAGFRIDPHPLNTDYTRLDVLLGVDALESTRNVIKSEGPLLSQLDVFHLAQLYQYTGRSDLYHAVRKLDRTMRSEKVTIVEEQDTMERRYEDGEQDPKWCRAFSNYFWDVIYDDYCQRGLI